MTAGGPTGGLLAVHAHPDDETLTSGALLATAALRGLPVALVTCTRGERGEVIGARLAHLEGDGPALARHREGELAAALTALGVRDHAFLDRLPAPESDVDGLPVRYEDSGMAWAGTARAARLADLPERAFVAAGLDEAAGRLALVIRSRRPAAVATYEPGGGYGHPDHVRAHEVTMRAIELAADPSWFPDLDAWAVPAVLWGAAGDAGLRACYRALAGLETGSAGRTDVDGGALTAPDPDGPLPSVAVPDAAIGLRVAVAPVLDAVLAALRAHATQVQAVEATSEAGSGVVATYALSNRVLAAVRTTEDYRVLGGPGTPAPGSPRGGRGELAAPAALLLPALGEVA